MGFAFAMAAEAAPLFAFLTARGAFEAAPGGAGSGPTVAAVRAFTLRGRRSGRAAPAAAVRAIVFGVGAVNAALAAAALHARGANLLVNVGTAGTLDGSLPLNAPVLVNRAAYVGPDATAFGYARGQIPGEPRFWEADAGLLADARAALAAAGVAHREGGLLTADSFCAKIPDPGSHPLMDPALVDMEGAGFMQAAAKLGVPALCVKFGSDRVDAPAPAADHERELENGYPRALTAFLRAVLAD